MTDSSPPRTRSRIPRFKSIEEEAEFWDTHDSTEFESEFKPTRVKFADKIEHVLMVPLERDVLDHLVVVSRSRGIALTELAAKFIANGLDSLDDQPAKPVNKKGKHHG